MSEQLGQLPADLRALVRAPEEFDESFANGEYAVVDARGCSSMGIARFLQDAHGLNMDGDHYFEEIPVARQNVGIWPYRKNEMLHIPKSAEIVGLNRMFANPEADLLCQNTLLL